MISPYTQRGVVDSTFYSILNMYRTMEQILGLPPLNVVVDGVRRGQQHNDVALGKIVEAISKSN